MIFTGCTSCEEPEVIYYEAGDPSTGMAERWECEKCKAINFSIHVSIGSETYSESDFFDKYPNAGKAGKGV